MEQNTRKKWGLTGALVSLLLTVSTFGVQSVEVNSPVAETPPDNSGPVKLLEASWLGGNYNDELVGAEIGLDGSIILVGNTVTLQFPGVQPTLLGPPGEMQQAAPPAPQVGETAPGKKRPDDPAQKWVHSGTFGYIVRLAPDGQKVLSYTHFGFGEAALSKIKLDLKGNIYLLGSAPNTLPLGEVKGSGSFIARLSPDAGRLETIVFHQGARDFGVDGNGEFVVLSDTRITRYPADGTAPEWTVTWPSYGANRPGAMAVSPRTGVTVVVGYGMTRTGHEPYKDPYAFGFNRSGKQIWQLWNPEPTKEAGTQYGGNGLMADTTGHAASADADGNLLLMLFADGGNTVLAHDPLDPSKPQDPAIFRGVFQATPGYGFHGANKTSVIFRVNPATGELEKGTFMSAWLGWPARDHANGLSIDAAAGSPAVKTADDGDAGLVFLVGGSASAFPTLLPWYQAAPGFYKGGGFLAVLNKDFKMLQAGYFPGASINSVAYRNGLALIAGSAARQNEAIEKDSTTGKEVVKTDPIRLYHPLQNSFGGGYRDGYFALLKVDEGK